MEDKRFKTIRMLLTKWFVTLLLQYILIDEGRAKHFTQNDIYYKLISNISNNKKWFRDKMSIPAGTKNVHYNTNLHHDAYVEVSHVEALARFRHILLHT